MLSLQACDPTPLLPLQRLCELLLHGITHVIQSGKKQIGPKRLQWLLFPPAWSLKSKLPPVTERETAQNAGWKDDRSQKLKRKKSASKADAEADDDGDGDSKTAAAADDADAAEVAKAPPKKRQKSVC